MIKLTQHQEQWRIEILDETFEFPDRKTFDIELKRLLDTKDKYGKVRKC